MVVALVLERGQGGFAEEQAAHPPEVAEDPITERRLIEVVDARRAARPRAAADHALHHPRVALPPDEHGLLHLDDGVDHLPRPGEAGELAVALEEDDARANA